MRKIILTGATGGLGKCLVDVLGKDNLNELICVYRNEDKFSSLREKYNGIYGYKLSESDCFQDLFSFIRCEETDFIVLILNAFSISPIKSVGDITAEEIEASVYGNIVRNHLLINETVKYCKTNTIGLRIVNLDSGAADHPLMGWSNYCASKAYMNSLLSVVLCENPEYEIVSVDPGVMDTNMQAQIRATQSDVFNQVDTFINYKKNGMLKKPEVVANQIVEQYVNDWKAQSLREKLR